MKENEPIELEVTISMTISKTVKIYLDKESDDIYKAVDEQITLPTDAWRYMGKNGYDCKDWFIDDYIIEREPYE